MDLGLSGWTAIVTGGSGGIGRGLVQGFAAEGCHVVIASRDAAQSRDVADSCKGMPGEVHVIPIDVTDANAVDGLVEDTRQRFGRLDVLVNNAGGVAYPRPFLEKPRDEWEWELDLNVRGVVHCTRAAVERMRAQGRGSIVNITSNSALAASAGNMVAHYAGAKGFVMSFSKALAHELGPLGIRINCVSPGWIVPHEEHHVGAGSFWKKYGYQFFGTPEAMAKQAEDGTLFNVGAQPLRRLGRPEDIADLVLFLASERAAHITGQLVSVSGGSWMP
ncbi:MAG TPA: SDR family oxidoreductase [Myxococcota bacterium]|nr:SDR family oxidoreductase [Myxococcota bacterium]